jgi:hypothetical protein
MGGEECIIILEGNKLQGAAQMLITTASASCQLVDYLSHRENWNDEDAKEIGQFHLKAQKKINELNEQLDELNRELAHKYAY